MGTTAYGGKGSKGRAVNGDRPVGPRAAHENKTYGDMPPPPPPQGPKPPPHPSSINPQCNSDAIKLGSFGALSDEKNFLVRKITLLELPLPIWGGKF